MREWDGRKKAQKAQKNPACGGLSERERAPYLRAYQRRRRSAALHSIMATEPALAPQRRDYGEAGAASIRSRS
jgi:hypothetical protein